MHEDRNMSKKIDAARKNLTKALKKHAEVVGGTAVSLKKAQRAAMKVQLAGAEYVEAVFAKTGIETPFEFLIHNGLEASTVASLTAERDAFAKKPHKKDS
jgi:predicted TPR repeat methyltransferase